MVAYSYRCSSCGTFDLSRPMGSGGSAATCPACGEVARRVFEAPRLGRAASDPIMRLLDTSARSASEPDVVDAIPGSGVRRPQPTTRDPRHARLPRP